jgi:hypothetical protein
MDCREVNVPKSPTTAIIFLTHHFSDDVFTFLGKDAIVAQACVSSRRLGDVIKLVARLLRVESRGRYQHDSETRRVVRRSSNPARSTRKERAFSRASKSA